MTAQTERTPEEELAKVHEGIAIASEILNVLCTANVNCEVVIEGAWIGWFSEYLSDVADRLDTVGMTLERQRLARK